jgi:hypothetical protein
MMILLSLIQLSLILIGIIVAGFVGVLGFAILHTILPGWVFWPLAVILGVILALGLAERLQKELKR